MKEIEKGMRKIERKNGVERNVEIKMEASST